MKTKIVDFLNESNSSSVTYDRLENLDGIENYTSDKYKIVKFAFNDEGDNAYALLDIPNKKLISWSMSGDSQQKLFKLLDKSGGRQKIQLNGYDMWLDVNRSMLYDAEYSMHGLGFDVTGEGDNIYIFSDILTTDEKKELVDYIKQYR